MLGKKFAWDVAIAIVSDEHTNSTVALCPPVVHYDDGGTYRPSRGQHALWESWLDFWNSFGKVDAKEKIAVFNGDAMERGGGNGRSSQLIVYNKATMFRIAQDAFEPAFDKVEKAYVMRGTPFHTGGAAWMEEKLAHDISIIKPFSTYDEIDPDTGKPKIKVGSYWHLQKVASGVSFDIGHTGSMGSLPWTEKHAALKLVERAMWRYKIDKNIEAPDVIVRSHRHVYSSSGDNFPTFGIFTPCWSLITEYAHNIGRENDTATVGGIWFLCKDGEYEYQKLFYEPKDAKEIWVVDAEF